MTRWISRNRSIASHPLVKESASRTGADLVTGQGTKGAGSSDVYIGWGYKTSGRWALEQAEKNKGRFQLFEDGFIRSLKPGYGKGALYSLVADQSGIYYDGAGRSDLVEGLNGRGEIADKLNGKEWEKEARSDLDRYLEIGASKYNWYPGEFTPEFLDRDMPEPGVVVVDQTFGDASIQHGRMEANNFHEMLEAALEENSGKLVYLRAHPDRFYRSKQSCFQSPLLRDERVVLLSAELAPWQVLDRAESVYVGTSLLGFEALMRDVPVVTFGCPFYAGWGLSDDRSSLLPAREESRTKLQLFQAALRLYSQYFDPDTLEPCQLSRILDHLALQKEMFGKNSGAWVTVGLSPWKRPLIRSFMTSPGNDLRQTRSVKRAGSWLKEEPSLRHLVWGRGIDGIRQDSPQPCRIEDGFLRSSGLGAEFHTPLSLVFDNTGIYYDCTSTSDLEALLQNHEFSQEELAEAELLIQIIRSRALTKYNLNNKEEAQAMWPDKPEAKCILVPGQVECDASIEFGSPIHNTNLSLLREVRRIRPNDIIAYKPHPDLVKSLRPGRACFEELEEACDLIVEGMDIVPWLETCDELHTLTSLAGFEALIRDKKVICHGAPFYSGWQLTEDLVPVERRSRCLTLEQLVAAVLLLYPRYINPETGEFTTAFGAADLIKKKGAVFYSRPWLLRMIASLKALLPKN